MSEIKRDIERLSVAQALYKAVGRAVKTGDRGSLRGKVDAALVEMYEDLGVKGVEMRLGGQKVGALGVAVSEGAVVSDRAAFEAWAVASGAGRRVRGVDLDRVPDGLLDAVVDAVGAVCPDAVTEGVEMTKGWDKRLVGSGTAVLDEGGEVVPGMQWRRSVKNTTLTGCEPADVAAAMASYGDPTTLASLLADAAEAFSALPGGGEGGE